MKNTVFFNFSEIRQILVRLHFRGGPVQDGVQKKKWKKSFFCFLPLKMSKNMAKTDKFKKKTYHLGRDPPCDPTPIFWGGGAGF